MLNHIVIMGRLTRDPELRRTGTGVAVASLTLAVDRDFGSRDGGERETDFIDIVAWRNTAEFVTKYFTKGRMAVVSGRLQIRNWNDKDGNKRRSAEVVADNIYFGDSRRDGDQGGQSFGNGGQSYGGNQGFNQQPYQGGGQSYGGGQPQNYGGGQSYGGQSYGNQGGYSNAPTPAPNGDFAMLDEDDDQLPF